LNYNHSKFILINALAVEGYGDEIFYRRRKNEGLVGELAQSSINRSY